LFAVSLPNEDPHSYRFAELGKSELYSLQLDSTHLKRNPFARELVFSVTPPAGAEDKKRYDADTAFKKKWDDTPDHWEVKTPILDSTSGIVPGRGLVYVRKITDWSRRNVKDREQGKRFEYFILIREPLKGHEITGDYLTGAREDRNTKEGNKLAIAFSFNSEGGNLFYEVTTKNKPERDGFRRHLAILFDGQVASAPTLNEPIRTNGQISGNFTQQEVKDQVTILRAGALPATLKKDPVSQNSMGATWGTTRSTGGPSRWCGRSSPCWRS